MRRDSLTGAASTIDLGGNVVIEDLMQPCPACEVPFQYGEEACSSCLAWLTSNQQLDSSPRGYFARKRQARIVAVGTKSLLAGCLIALFLIQLLITESFEIDTRRKDIIFAAPAIVLVVGGMIVHGMPGHTLHHYPGSGLIRRGRPRWWKGVAASAGFIMLAVVVCELFNRPILEGRAWNSWYRSAAEIAGAVTTINLAIYAAVALMLLWFLLATVLGPQDMDKDRRKNVMHVQKQRDARPSARIS